MGLYCQASCSRTMLRARSIWDQALAASSRAQEDDWSERIDAGPFEPRLMLLERRILLGGGSVPVLVQIGQDAQMVTSAAREFGRELAIFLAILWLALSLAAWAQVALGLRPLARIQTALDRLRRSPSERLAAEGQIGRAHV